MTNRLIVNISDINQDFGLEKLGVQKTQMLVLSVMGSHLYGTNTPHSDFDYRGVYIPNKKQILLNDFKHTINAPKDSGVDLQVWSIHHFMKLARNGETLALDLLHAPRHFWLMWNEEIWGTLFRNRTLFYTQKMRAFVGFAKKQAAKYGIKGDRIAAYENVIDFLSSKAPYDGKLQDVWNDLPKGDHIHFHDVEPFKMYEVCGKKFQETVKVSYALEHIRKSLTEYGDRAKLARQNEGVDWKALSHAVKTVQQVNDVLVYGQFTLPLRSAEYVMDIKLGKIDFSEVHEYLEANIENIERMMNESSLPEEVDKETWDNWMLYVFDKYVFQKG